MRKTVSILTVLIVGIFFVSLFSGDFAYEGAGKCKMCHKTEKQGQQHPIWEASKHSKSYQALSTDAAKELCPNPTENTECLGCHAPLHEKAAELKEEGVTCEICHGPGSEYKKLSVMKDREQSKAKGLIVYESAEAVKKQCLTCHENAHDKPFDFEAAWEKIKHDKPE